MGIGASVHRGRSALKQKVGGFIFGQIRLSSPKIAPACRYDCAFALATTMLS